MCTWTFREEALQVAESGTVTEQAAAKKLLENYQQLAEVIVLSPEGELVDHRDMDEILKRFPEATGNWEGDVRAIQYFLSFLAESAQKAMASAART